MIPQGHHPRVEQEMNHLATVWNNVGPITFHVQYTSPVKATVKVYAHGRRVDVRVVSLGAE